MSADAAAPQGGLDRRQFLVAGASVLGGLLIGIDVLARPAAAEAAGAGGRVTVYIHVGSDEVVTIVCPNSEMGQGTSTALPLIVAEELMVDWQQVRMELAGADVRFAFPGTTRQLTAGSTAVRRYHGALRTAGAAAREMLITAAAERFGVDRTLCVAEHGTVRDTVSGQVATYGELAAAAAAVTPPSNPPLTPKDRLRLIGRPLPRLDLPAKVDGSARYGIDVRLPDMLYAGVQQAPRVGQTLKSFGSPPGGMTAHRVPGGVAVVTSTTTWQAIRAAAALKTTWTDAPYTASLDSADMHARANALLRSGEGARVARSTGDAPGAVAGAATKLSATYDVPYLAHATLEPMNATAVVRDDSCEIWAPTQGQTAAVATAAAITGLPTSKITLHTTFLGGGLGRRIETDFVAQAVTVALAHKGKPVKLVWSREQDFTHDFYRPSAQCRLDAGLDASGALKALDIRTVSPSIFYQRNPKLLDDPAWYDRIAVEGLADMPYGLEHLRVEWVRDPAEVPVGFWRSVGHSHNAFFLESFLDEVAAKTGRDPFAVRRDLLSGRPRHVAVLDALERHSGWATAAPAGHARGMAFSECFGSLSGQVAEVSGTPSDPVVHRITIVVDCGTTINPDIARAQLEGGVMHGLSAALDGAMPFQDGEPRKRNFDSYGMLRMEDAPAVDVHLIESGGPLGGLGEVGVPCVGPALTNAFARLGGTRVRTLPLEEADD